jgi:aryl-alcohol dehydrogenase-like predicted oxidoreductase
MQVPPRTFDPFERVNIASTGVEISRMGVGGGPLGNLQSVVTDANATFLLEEALGAGIRYFDTAPLYGMGLSEQRIGRVLSKASRTSFVLATKVGRLLRRDAEPDPELFHDYLPPSAEARARTERIGEICDRWSVPARAAALQFRLAHPAVSAVVLGMRTVAELRDNIEMMRLEIPRQLWPALKDSGVLPSDAPTPDRTWLR